MNTFSDFQLHPDVLRAMTELGFEKPSPIQAATWPQLLGAHTDFIGLAATGTGKTAAFSVPMLMALDPSQKATQSLILCPTRELALQVADQVNRLGQYLGFKALTIYGGSSYSDQHRGLQTGTSIIVGTPGRVCDHLRRGTLKLDKLKVLILDEADAMLSMGFYDELTMVLDSCAASQRAIWLFSATMDQAVRRVADKYLRNPRQAQVIQQEKVPAAIEQTYYVTQESNKPEVLRKLIDHSDSFYGLVFCQTKALVMELTQYLQTHGYRVDCLHSDKSQSARETTMRSFRERRVNLLICTDVAARGLDVREVSHVVNYTLPNELESYVHRVGRTARGGRSGRAMSLVSPRQRALLTKIERFTQVRLKEGVIPSRKDIGLKKVSRLLEDFSATEGHSWALETLSEEWKLALATMSGEEIAARFLSLQFPHLFTGPETAAPAIGATIVPRGVSSQESAPSARVSSAPAPVRKGGESREPRSSARPASATKRRPAAAKDQKASGWKPAARGKKPGPKSGPSKSHS